MKKYRDIEVKWYNRYKLCPKCDKVLSSKESREIMEDHGDYIQRKQYYNLTCICGYKEESRCSYPVLIHEEIK